MSRGHVSALLDTQLPAETIEDAPLHEEDLSASQRAEFERYVAAQRQYLLEKFMRRSVFSRVLQPARR